MKGRWRVKVETCPAHEEDQEQHVRTLRVEGSAHMMSTRSKSAQQRDWIVWRIEVISVPELHCSVIFHSTLYYNILDHTILC